MSTHVKGPKRWFESRDTLADASSVDFDWLCDLVQSSLRQLQMARRWKHMAEISMTFDDLTALFAKHAAISRAGAAEAARLQVG